MNPHHFAYHLARHDIKGYLATKRQFKASPRVSKYSSACGPTKNGELAIDILHVLHHICDTAVVDEPNAVKKQGNKARQKPVAERTSSTRTRYLPNMSHPYHNYK